MYGHFDIAKPHSTTRPRGFDLPFWLGTWPISGRHWGHVGSIQEREHLIEYAIDSGLTAIDTAPIYGFGAAEELVGRALKKPANRNRAFIATKFGLIWDEQGRVQHNASPSSMQQEVDSSLKRLGLDCIDLYQLHWLDKKTPLAETLGFAERLQEQGKIKAVGLCNMTMATVADVKFELITSIQSPLNLLEQETRTSLLRWCSQRGMYFLAYSPLCQGLLSGKYDEQRLDKLGKKDVRTKNNAFRRGVKQKASLDLLRSLASELAITPAQLALLWVKSTPGVTQTLVGIKTKTHVNEMMAIRKLSLENAVYDALLTAFRSEKEHTNST